MIPGIFAVGVAAVGPRRRWRINVSAVDGGAGVSLAEMQFRATVGGASLCVGGAPSASSIFSGGQPASNAFDGNPSTIWASASGPPQWLRYDFATGSDVNQVMIQAREDGGTYGQTPASFDVESSADGSTWDLEWSVTGSTGWSASEIRTFSRP